MGSEITQEQISGKITAARRDAEGLKDKIKRRKDDLMDTNRKYPDEKARLSVLELLLCARGYICYISATLCMV